jgi:ankyrin repeat protein
MFLIALAHNTTMQEKSLQENALAKKPAEPKTDIAKSGKPPLSAKEQQGWHDIYLLDAAKYGENEKIMRLLKVGADINAKDNGNETALHYAVLYGYTQTFALLIGKGANITAQDNFGRTALDMVTVKNKEKTETAQFFKSMKWLAGITGNSFMKSFADCLAG